jgi:hypothetical protein
LALAGVVILVMDLRLALAIRPSETGQRCVSLELLSPLIYRNCSCLLLVGPVWRRRAAARNRVTSCGECLLSRVKQTSRLGGENVGE